MTGAAATATDTTTTALPEPGSPEAAEAIWKDLEKPGQPFGSQTETAGGDGEAARPQRTESADAQTNGTKEQDTAAGKTPADVARPDWVSEADWSAASPSLRQALTAREEGWTGRLTQTEKRFKGVISGQTRKIAELSGQTKTKGEGDTKLAKAIEDFKREYPDVAGPVEALIDTATAPLRESAKINDERAQAEHLELQEQAIQELQPHYNLIAKSKPFTDWYTANQHNPAIRDPILRNAEYLQDAEEVSAVIDLFKAQTKWQPPAADSETTDQSGKGGSTSQPANQTKTDAKRALQKESAAGTSHSVATAGPALAPENDPAALWKEAGQLIDRKSGRKK